MQKAQEKGKYSLNDASLIFKAISFLEKNVECEEVKDELVAFQILVSSVEVGQNKGTYSLEEASSLYAHILELVEYSKEVTEKRKGKEAVVTPPM